MLRYSIDQGIGLVTVDAAGAVSAAQVRNLRQELRGNPDYHTALPVLFDLSGASQLDFTADDLRQLAASTMTQAAARQALVVTSELGFGLARMFQTFSGVSGQSQNVRVFRDAAEARAWLLQADEV